MKKFTISSAIALFMILVSVTAALAYTFPSTNDQNKIDGFPYVELVSQDYGEVTLKFVNDTNSLAYFEYRIDGIEKEDGTPHPVISDDYIYPGVTVNGIGISEPVIVVETFSANEYVEIRLALGGERDWDFDWTQFDVLSLPVPTEIDQCKDGGWMDFFYPDGSSFMNQGLCIQFVLTGK